LVVSEPTASPIEYPETERLILVQGNSVRNISSLDIKRPTEEISKGKWVSKEAIESAVRQEYPENPDYLLAVINCESGLDNTKIGKAGEVGLSQFKIGTWNAFNRQRGTDLDIYNPYHQVELMAWSFRNGLQNHWSCIKLI